jgi:GNAT superfamily N-acetyltransferase
VTGLPVELADGSPGTHLRHAMAADLPALVALLADDPLGRAREEPTDLSPYLRAFAQIAADSSQLLVVGTSGDDVVATLQLSFLPGLSRQGALRAQIEGVRVRADWRSRGTGAVLISWAIDEARARGCAVVQLTSDRSRTDALRFYQRLGFVDSHAGLKLAL